MPHQQALVGHLDAGYASIRLAHLFDLAGSFLQITGDAKEASYLYRRALGERLLGPDNLDTLTSVNNLARCLVSFGDAEAALPLLQRAVTGAEPVLGAEHPWTRRFKASLAECEKALRG